MIEEKITKNTKLMLKHAIKKDIMPRNAALEIAKARIKIVLEKRQNEVNKENKSNNI